ncbi:sensor histidine kinase [Terribacillus sp. JSM ZJ617]|uniref:sensor histidine kinase n=1 Tax=Terribacillus sp. JSM ZJ617 TaxID=3342119 RepID=UPI0035A98841
MNRISFKLSLWFLLAMVLLQVILFYILHTGIVDSRIEEELYALQSRGNSHRDVLEDTYDEQTLHHIAVMEQSAETEVIITDQNHNILASSTERDNEITTVLNRELSVVPRIGKVLEDNWKSEKYLSTVTPYITNDNGSGYVYMFRSTAQVQDLISRLNHHFIIAAVITFILLIVTAIFLTRALTNPLIRMKKATEKLIMGDFTAELPKMGEDELGDLGRSIKTLTRELQHLKKERNEFLASISHELRTPLTYIKGYADVARRQTLSGTERNKYLSIIFEESEKLNEMLKDLFDLARIDRNIFEIETRPVELQPYLYDIYERVLPVFKERNKSLEIQCKDNYIVYIDPIRFEQIIRNLLDNALKYSEENTRTIIKAQRERNNIVVDVIDQGYGIPKAEIPYIFERFYRVEKSRSRDSGGTGLGLSIAKELAEAHHAKLTVKSKVGTGTTFSITLEESETP